MAKQPGKDMLIKIGDDSSPPSFTTVAGLTTKTMGINKEQVDVTDSDSVNEWRELLSGAGVKSVSLSGEGRFSGGATDSSLREAAMDGTHLDYQVVVPGLGTFEGPFEISSFEYSGEYTADIQFSMSLESAGEISFEAE